ncbi:MAG: ribosomal protein S18-alanine N-acetyltransferase [Anaerolineales bacterium]
MVAIPVQVHIREMTLEDLPGVLEIDRVSFPVPWPERSYRFELIDNPAAQLFVAETLDEAESQVVGFIGYWLIGDEVHISTFAIHPDYRKQGIGESMMVRALGTARTRGAALATLEVRVSNLPAIHLYEKLGFEPVGRRAGYYRDNGEDALLMTLHRLADGGEP